MRIGRILALGAAATAAAASAFALTASTATAATGTVSAQLGMTGVQTGEAPGGTHAVYVPTGTAVTFGLGSPPGGAQALLGWSKVILNASALPGGSSGVGLDRKTTVTYTFDAAGTFGFSWTAYGTAGVRITPTPGEYTSAAIVVTGGGTPSGSPSTSSSGPSSSPSGSATGSNPGGVPSFGAPSDHGLGASTSPLTTPSRGSSSASGTSSEPLIIISPSPSSSTTTHVVAGVAHRSTPARPVGLAVIAIVAFALVTGWYAYQYFGLDALRRG